MAWAAAIPIATAVLGGMGGKSKAKQSKQPTKSFTNPAEQLGGWGKLKEIMDRMGSAPQYKVGANNPYLSSGMSHLMGRAGIPQPETGYGPNPYLQPGGGGGPALPTPPPPGPGAPQDPKLGPKVKGMP